MREIIDDMFYWNARGMSIEDFCDECFDTKDFIESILKLNQVTQTKKLKNYNIKLEEIQNSDLLIDQKRHLFKEKIRTENENIDQRKVNFIKALEDYKQKRLE